MLAWAPVKRAACRHAREPHSRRAGTQQILTLPAAFGPSWDQFVANWCLSVPPGIPEKEAIAALEALERLCPTYVVVLVSGPTRGLAVAAPAIEFGRVLQQCEGMPGFQKILPRLRRGDRSAFSEAHYAAALARAGCNPEIEPASGVAVLDTAVDWHGTRVYSEVISPERADAIVAAQTDLRLLANAIRDAVPGSVVEVLLETDITPETQAAVLRSIQALAPDEPTRIEGLATMVRRAASIPLQVGPTIRYEGPGPVIAAAAGRVEGDVAAAGVVRMPISDSRARRLLAAELHHFSRETHNILAVDITAVTVGPRDWAALIRRSFQPAQNRRIGAVVFFSRALVGIPLAARQMWAVVVNEHAYRPIPGELLAAIASLDESAQFRGTSPEL